MTGAELEKSVIVTDGIGEITWSQVIQDFVSHYVEFGFILKTEGLLKQGNNKNNKCFNKVPFASVGRRQAGS